MNLFNLQQLEHLDSLDDLDDSEYERIAAQEKEAKQKRLQDRFESRFTGKRPWLIRNREKRVGRYYLSFLFNIISALAGFYGSRVLMQIFPIPYLDWILATILLFYVEKYKRKYSDLFWDTFWKNNKQINWSAGSKNFSLFLFSLVLSGFGVFFFVHDTSKEAKLMGESGDPEAVAMQDRVKQLDADIKALREDPNSYNSEGKFYYKLLDDEGAMKEERATLIATLRDKHGIYNIMNKNILFEWNIRKNYRRYLSVFITLISEILFELCMCFCSYYDWRLFLALKKANPLASGAQYVNGKSQKKNPVYQ